MGLVACGRCLSATCAGCDVQQLSVLQKQQLVCLLHRQLEQQLAAAAQHLPRLAQRLTYLQPQQQQQQQRQGWVALGLPLQQGAGCGTGAGAADSSHAAK
jgi:D-alanyl-D-alanine dipeptidase